MVLGFPWAAQASEKTVTIAGFGGNDVYVMHNLVKNVLSDDFKRLGIEVNYFAVESDYPKYILNSLSSGNAPDAFYVDVNVAQSWIGTGRLAPLSEQLVAKREDIFPKLLDSYRFEGSIYGIPKDVNALVLVYNKDIFRDAGVPFPEESDDWHQLRTKLASVVSALADEGVTGACLTPEFSRFAPFAYATGWQPMDSDNRTRLDENFRRAFEFYTGLVKDGVARLPSDLGQRWGGGCFATERAAITLEGNWLSAYLRDKSPNLLYGSSLLPKDPETGDRGNLLFTAAWAVNDNSRNKAEIEEVIALLTSQEAQQAVLESGLALPSTVSLKAAPYFKRQASPNQLADTIYQATQSGQVYAYSFDPYGSSWAEPITEALSSVMLGELSVTEALEEAQARYDRMWRRLQR